MQQHMLSRRRFDQLQAVDIEGVPPALRAGVEGAHQLREDVPRVYENRLAPECEHHASVRRGNAMSVSITPLLLSIFCTV